MRKKKMLFIYNPCAGKGAMKSKLSDVMETFMRADYEGNCVCDPAGARGDGTGHGVGRKI